MTAEIVISSFRTEDGYDVSILPKKNGQIEFGIDDVFTKLSASETDKLILMLRKAKKQSMAR